MIEFKQFLVNLSRGLRVYKDEYEYWTHDPQLDRDPGYSRRAIAEALEERYKIIKKPEALAEAESIYVSCGLYLDAARVRGRYPGPAKARSDAEQPEQPMRNENYIKQLAITREQRIKEAIRRDQEMRNSTWKRDGPRDAVDDSVPGFVMNSLDYDNTRD